MFVSLLQLSFFMSLISRSYAQILGFRWFLTAMAIYSSLWVAPSDFQQGENYRMIYVHVPAARMSLLVHIAVAIGSFLFLLTKHPLLTRFSRTGLKIGAFSTLLTLVTGGFRGKPMWGTFWVWDARLTPVFILFFIHPGALCFQKLSVELAPISICIGLINIPIIKFPVNWWNTSHQPGSISQFGTPIHVSMPIPILFNFANSPFPTCILLVLGTRLLIPSFLESSFITEARSFPNEGGPKEATPTRLLAKERDKERAKELNA
nr:cytochrome c biogenesis C [Sciadopitys verticillata]